ncbi:MAG: amidohydrolase family protein [Dehalococcoidia bacterium]
MADKTPVVDSHHHFWDLSKFDYPWMPPGDNVLRRNYGPDDLRPLINKVGVNKTVIIQAAQSVDETRWLLEIAESADFVAGVVGWVDLAAPDVGHTLDELQKSPYFKGVRHIWEGEEDPGWLAKPEAIRGLKEIERRGLCYDFLARPQNLRYIPEIMDQAPNLRAVLDHIAKPAISEHMVEPWLSDIRRVANINSMRCKVSGMVTEADHRNWKVDDLRPYVAHVLGMFGYDRLMFGTDWPVCTLAASYQQVTDAARELLSSLRPEESAAVFGGNAIKFYRLCV